ncbi:DegT/DnrJ/EryC1/StrS aminotransferase [Desulfosarcina variabilis str. Montpellier]|uniref:DegT/DnrJ/EryC1/StrS family aminotransferase n=1 Tax=Desulfosarcina variabilis TaxID=2300 RepID=UPI003AFB4DC5
MQFIDLETQQKRIKPALEKRIRTVLDHGKYIMGPEVAELEKTLAAYTNVNYGIGCASGTDALLMALMAYQVGPGDAVFTTPFTFIATAEVLQLLGATPVFVDIDPGTFNIDPVLLEKAIIDFDKNQRDKHPISDKPDSALTPKGIIAVDLFGQPADYSAINTIAKQHDLFVIEDAAQSFGAEYNGKKSCSLANIACTSFFPAKPLGGYGDGGMCFTDDDRLADVMRSIRNHGQGSDKYDNIRIGINGRLDTLQAAILLTKFDIFPDEIQLRNEVSNRYSSMLKDMNALATPIIKKNCRSVWAQYSLIAQTTEQRDIFQKALKDNNIPTAIYYPKPLHLQTAFHTLGYQKGDFPISEQCAEAIFSLPMHPYLSESTQWEISSILKHVKL